MTLIFKQTAENIKRNLALAVSTTIAIALIVTIFNVLLALLFGSQNLIAMLSQKATITVYVKDELDFYDIKQLIKKIETLPGVIPPVVYTSGKDATEAVTKTFSLDPNVLQKYELTLPASLTIAVKDTNDFKIVEQTLAAPPFTSQLQNISPTQQVREGSIFDNVAENITALKRIAFRTVFLVLMLFFFAGTLLIAHLLHVHVVMRKKEFSLMKLLGTPRKTLEAPLLFESITYTLCGVLLSLPFFLLIAPFAMAPALLLNTVLIELLIGILLSVFVTVFVTHWYIAKDS